MARRARYAECHRRDSGCQRGRVVGDIDLSTAASRFFALRLTGAETHEDMCWLLDLVVELIAAIGKITTHHRIEIRSPRQYSHDCIQVGQLDLTKLLAVINMKTGFLASLSCWIQSGQHMNSLWSMMTLTC